MASSRLRNPLKRIWHFFFWVSLQILLLFVPPHTKFFFYMKIFARTYSISASIRFLPLLGVIFPPHQWSLKSRRGIIQNYKNLTPRFSCRETNPLSWVRNAIAFEESREIVLDFGFEMDDDDSFIIESSWLQEHPPWQNNKEKRLETPLKMRNYKRTWEMICKNLKMRYVTNRYRAQKKIAIFSKDEAEGTKGKASKRKETTRKQI